MLKLRLLVCVIPALGRNDSLGHDLHEEGSGDLRVEGHLGGEIAGGLDGLDLDGLRVHRSLVGQSDGDGLVGDTTEQLAGLGHLGGDLDGSALDGGLSGDGVLAGSDGLGQTSALHSDDLSLSALGPRESEALREQVVAGVAGLHVDNVTGMAQVGHGLGENNLGFSHCSKPP